MLSCIVSVPLRGNVNNDPALLPTSQAYRVSVPLRGNVNNDKSFLFPCKGEGPVSVPLRGNVNNDARRIHS